MALVVPLALPATTPAAFAQSKTIYIPSRWQSTGEVPWSQDRTQESRSFILLWGDLSGTNPRNAPSQYRFDPDNILSQLESLYDFYVNDMRFTPETGLLAEHKIIVIITRTWSNAPNLEAWATGGSVDGRVGIINIAPAAAAPGSWGLAHESAHVFQNYTFLGRPGMGFTHPSAGTFWETSAEFMAMQVYPTGGAGDLTRFIRTENLRYDSSRHHYGNWMLLQYIKDRDGIGMFNRMWNEARNTEHPLEVYRRINNLSQAELNRRIGDYAARNVTWDYSNRSDFMRYINQLYPFVTVYNGVQAEAVNASAGHYRIPDAVAPGAYGYNKIRVVPSSDGALVRMRLRGHVNTAAQSGWTFGFVAIGGNGTPRYGPLTSSADATVSFQLQPGEREVYLVVTGTPGTVHKYGFLEGYPRNYRHPYQFRIEGAVPYGFEPGHTRPNPTGGRWHSNGGGWVDNRANVASTAYVGPRAAVFGNSTVTGNARIEGLAWVNSGATVGGDAVVKDSALVQGGSNLSGSAVIAGDAEPAWACSSGSYRMFVPDRQCDGRVDVPAENDINPPYTPFTDAQMAIGGGTGTDPDPTPTPTPTPTTTSPPPGPGACTASYAVVGQWQGGFQAEVTVTAGGSAIDGWRVSWAFPSGQTVQQAWNADVNSSGGNITADDVSWNGALPAGGSTAFGFLGSYTSANNPPTLTCAPR
jgi:cellulase/cellobiase CelA1